jgi:small subunit ribosomal protein S19e
MGYKPSRFVKGSGNIARKSLQQLEKAGLIKQVQRGVHKGRVVTPVGQKLLDSIATQISKVKQ